MKIYRLVLSENTIPIYCLPVKFIDRQKGQVGFVLYYLNKKGISKDFILHRHHGILALPEVDKSQNDVDTTKINTVEDFITLFLDNFDNAGLNKDIRETAVDLDFELTDEDKRVMIDQFDIDEEGKFDNTIFLV
jgi:light-regulated signal transduction histidine kinase (bacteriophytochrome)